MVPSARSRPRGGVGYLGHIPEVLVSVLTLAHSGGFSVASNFARDHSAEVALAASCGWISTVSPDGLAYGRVWRITLEGHSLLNSIIEDRRRA